MFSGTMMLPPLDFIYMYNLSRLQ